MARNWREHERGDRVKWVIVFTAVLALAVIVTAVITKGFTDWNPYGWFGEKQETTSANVTVHTRLSGTDSTAAMYVPLSPAVYVGDPQACIEGQWFYDIKSDVAFENASFAITLDSTGHITATQLTEHEYPIVKYGIKGVAGTVLASFGFADSTQVPGSEITLADNVTLMVLGYASESGTAVQLSNGILFDRDVAYGLPEADSVEGYTFTGWAYDAENEQPYNGEKIEDPTSLYPVYAIDTVQVNFDSAGGSAVSPILVDWNSLLQNLPVPEYTGFSFVGWRLDDTVYTDTPVKDDVTLTAVWDVQDCTVTFLLNAADCKTVTVKWGTTYAEALQKAGLTDYIVLNDDVGAVVTSDTTVRVDKKPVSANDGQKVGLIVACVVGGVVVIGVIAALCRRKRY